MFGPTQRRRYSGIDEMNETLTGPESGYLAVRLTDTLEVKFEFVAQEVLLSREQIDKSVCSAPKLRIGLPDSFF